MPVYQASSLAGLAKSVSTYFAGQAGQPGSMLVRTNLAETDRLAYWAVQCGQAGRGGQYGGVVHTGGLGAVARLARRAREANWG